MVEYSIITKTDVTDHKINNNYLLPCHLVQAAFDIVSWVAFVATHRAHVMACGLAVWHQEPGVGHHGGFRTLYLTVRLREGPQAILQTHQPVTVTWNTQGNTPSTIKENNVSETF